MKKVILITFLGTFIGLIVGIALTNLDQDSRFNRWHLINSSIKFKHIINATTGSLKAEAIDNKIYMRDTSTVDDSGWSEDIVSIKALLNERTTIINGTCITEEIKYPKDPAGKVVECARTTGDTGDGIYVTNYYALLDDGSIWVWKYDTLTAVLYFPTVATFYGFLLSILLSSSFYFLKKRRNKTQITMIINK